MNTNTLSAVAVCTLASITACSADQPAGSGTQVGIEEVVVCRVSDEVQLTDLDAIPEGFSDSPNTILDQLSGTFTGPLLAEEEVVLGGEATLVMSVPSAEVTLVTFDVEFTDGAESEGYDESGVCPPALALELDLTLTAEAFPSFSGQIPATVSAEDQDPGVTWGLYATVDPTDGLDQDLPEPSTFDPGTVDRLEARLQVSGHEDSRGVALSWRGEIDDGGGEDGSASIVNELLYMAQLQRNVP